MKKIICITKITVLILLGTIGWLGHSAYSQENNLRTKFSVPTEQFEGEWVATVGEYSYELTIVKKMVYMELFKVDVESLMGSMIWKKNGHVIRSTEIDGVKALLVDKGLPSVKEARFSFKDSEKEIAGNVDFIIDADNANLARWTLIIDRQVNMILGWKTVEFDIPKELTFEKVQ
ncbi:hypothetical protein M2134_000160 [Parabacteroides sp. PM6-13]|uniref:hypothetical protein n=1 Tax=Parabacteroides sp. PM6-13 TaxID=1742408 RepID=UPI0024752D97|nr:hypothetical protein [Parabacteroides sp. PM6-13]MDH6341308.1 hypothetical protein [Parabacteroides sp. PM6-13]